ncbi:MAG: hypothetical protein AAFO91_10720, partial [Bacteroidota bacterium]
MEIINYKIVLVIIGATVLGTAAALSLSGYGTDEQKSEESYMTMAEALVEQCATEERTAVCYEREVPKLMDQGYEMEEAFTVTKLIQDIDPSFQYCHVLGHYISAKETAK